MAYDSQCYDLAAYFLAGSPASKDDLAQHIQDAVEAWISINPLSSAEEQSLIDRGDLMHKPAEY